MAMDHYLPSFADELTKIAVSAKNSHFRQLRKGRRPISVGTLMTKEQQLDTAQSAPTDSGSEYAERETGQGMQEGMGV